MAMLQDNEQDRLQREWDDVFGISSAEPPFAAAVEAEENSSPELSAEWDAAFGLAPPPEPAEPATPPEDKGFWEGSVLDQLVGGFWEHQARGSRAEGYEAAKSASGALAGEPIDTKNVDRLGITAFTRGSTPERRAQFAQEQLEKAQRLLDKGAEYAAKGEAIPYSDETLDFIDESRGVPMAEALKNAPATIVAELGARSGYASLTSAAQGAGASLLTGGNPIAFGLGMGAGSARVEYANILLEELQKRGVDLTDAKSLARAVSDPELIQDVEKAALVGSAAVGGWDAVAGWLGGKMLTPFVKSRLGRELANMGVQMPAQMVTGAAGEASKQLLLEGEITAPREVAAEAVGELVTAPIEVGAAAWTGARGKRTDDTGTGEPSPLEDIELSPEEELLRLEEEQALIEQAEQRLEEGRQREREIFEADYDLNARRQAAREEVKAAGGDLLTQALAEANVVGNYTRTLEEDRVAREALLRPKQEELAARRRKLEEEQAWQQQRQKQEQVKAKQETKLAQEAKLQQETQRGQELEQQAPYVAEGPARGPALAEAFRKAGLEQTPPSERKGPPPPPEGGAAAPAAPAGTAAAPAAATAAPGAPTVPTGTAPAAPAATGFRVEVYDEGTARWQEVDTAPFENKAAAEQFIESEVSGRARVVKAAPPITPATAANQRLSNEQLIAQAEARQRAARESLQRGELPAPRPDTPVGETNPDGEVVVAKGELHGLGVDYHEREQPGTESNYGEFRGTRGADQMPLDFIEGKAKGSQQIFIVDQVDEAGQFVQHKVMVGFTNAAAARRAHNKRYPGKARQVGAVTEMTPDQFTEWALQEQTAPVAPKLRQKATGPVQDLPLEQTEQQAEQLVREERRKARQARRQPAQVATKPKRKGIPRRGRLAELERAEAEQESGTRVRGQVAPRTALSGYVQEDLVVHETRPEAIDGIREGGLLPSKARPLVEGGSAPAGIYFLNDHKDADPTGDIPLIGIPRDALVNVVADPMFSKTGSITQRKAIPPENLYLWNQQKEEWQPLVQPGIRVRGQAAKTPLAARMKLPEQRPGQTVAEWAREVLKPLMDRYPGVKPIILNSALELPDSIKALFAEGSSNLALERSGALYVFQHEDQVSINRAELLAAGLDPLQGHPFHVEYPESDTAPFTLTLTRKATGEKIEVQGATIEQAEEKAIAVMSWEIAKLRNLTRGQVYIFANGFVSRNNPVGSAQGLIEAFLHEGIGHKGLAMLGRVRAYGKSVTELQDEIYASMTEAEKQAILDHGYDLDLSLVDHQRSLADEHVAYLAQTDPRHTLVQRVVAWVREVLRKLGYVQTWTENDLVGLLAKSRRLLASDAFEIDTEKGVWGVELDLRAMVAKAKEATKSIFVMPETGTTKGDESLLLYRFVSGERLNPGNDYGMHWTHNYSEMEQMASEEPGYIITARHPGYSSVMDWENSRDRPVMEQEIGGYEYRDKVFPEVPIRPGTSMDVLSIEKVDIEGNRSWIKKPAEGAKQSPATQVRGMARKLPPPEVPDVDATEYPVLPVGRVERPLIRAFERAKKEGREITSRVLSYIPGSPAKRRDKQDLDRNVRPTSYPELRKMLEWAIQHNHLGLWYDQFGRGLAAIVGKANMREASILFGITSQQNSTENNLADTLSVMAAARERDPLDRKAFTRYLRNYKRPDGQKLKLTGDQIERILDLYATGAYRGGLKVANYMETVLRRSRNQFQPFTVQDVHMARVFGFRYRDVDKKTGKVVDAAKFPDELKIRYAQWLTGKLAVDYNLRPDEVQAYLWFYAKRKLSPKATEMSEEELAQRNTGAGTWMSSRKYASAEIAKIQQMVNAGQFDRTAPRTAVLAENRPAMYKEKPSEGYSNYEHYDQLLDLARERAATVVVSLNPGNARGYGFPADVTLDQLQTFQDRVLERILDGTGQIRFLRELGVTHEVYPILGTWDRMEPSLEIVLPGETLATADLLAPLLGHAFLQDAAITAQPRWTGQQFGVHLARRDGQRFTQQDLAEIYATINPEQSTAGMNFSLSRDGTALKFLDGSFFEKDNYSDEDLLAFAERLEPLTIGGIYHVGFYGQEGNWFDTSQSPGNIQEVWDRGTASGSSDIQGAAFRDLYEPVWEAYRETLQELGYTPSNTAPPVTHLGQLPAATAALVAQKAAPAKAPSVQVRAMAAPRAGAVVTRQDRTSPLGVGHTLAATQEALLADNTPVSALKSRLSGLSEAAREALLATIPRRNLRDFIDETVMPALHRYVRLANRMDGRRNELLEPMGKLARRWNTFITQNRTQGRQLGELMQAATLAGVDPAENYKPLKDPAKMDATEQLLDRTRRANHRKLQAFWSKLDPEAQAIYKAVRKAHVDQRTTLWEGLQKRIQESGASDTAKASLLDTLRLKFEAGRVQGVYFPLQRFGRHFVVVRNQAGEVEVFSKYENEYERKRAAQEWRDAGFLVEEGVLPKTLSHEFMREIDPDFVRRVSQFVEGDTKAETQALQDEIWQMYLRTLPEMSMRKAFIHRKGRLGFSADAIRSFSFAMFHGAHQIARLEYVYQLEGELRDLRQQAAEMVKAQHVDAPWAVPVLDEMVRRHDHAMNPDGAKWATSLTSLGFAWYLGVTPAAAFVNLTQTPIVAMPVLASKFGFLGTNRELLKVSGELARHRGQFGDRLRGDEKKAWEEFYRIGLFDKTQAHDLAGISEDGMDYSQRTQRALEVASFLFHTAEQANRIATAMAAYRLGRKKGLDHEAALLQAEDLTWDSHFDYGINNRPRVMQGNFMRVLLLFRQYSANMTYRVARDFKNGFLDRIKDPQVRKEARTRFVGMMTMTSLFAGVTGLPLYSVVVGALEALFGDDDEPLDIEASLRHWLAEYFQDADYADAIMKGLFDTGTGWSISNRVSLSQLWVRDAPENLDGKDLWLHYLGEAAGPVFGIGENMAQGAVNLWQGDVRGLQRFVPKFIRDTLRAYEYGTQGATNMRPTRDVLIPAEDFAFLELAGQAIGFTPSQLNTQYEQGRAVMDVATKLQRRRSNLLNRLFLGARLEDNQAMNETLKEIVAFNEKNPQIRIDADTIRRSARSRARYSAGMHHGVTVDKDLLYLHQKYDFTSQGRE